MTGSIKPLNGIVPLAALPRPTTANPTLHLNDLEPHLKSTVESWLLRLAALRIRVYRVSPAGLDYDDFMQTKGAFAESAELFVRLFPFTGEHPLAVVKVEGDIRSLKALIDRELIDWQSRPEQVKPFPTG